MTSRNFSVETRGQGILILGGYFELNTNIIEEFLLVGAKAIIPQTLEEIHALQETHDIDYILIFPDFDPSQLKDYLETLIRSGESKLIVASHYNEPAIGIDQSRITKKIEYGDFIGHKAMESSYLKKLLNSITQKNELHLSNDGLSELHIFGVKDLARLITAATLKPGHDNKYLLINPEGISHLNIAYLLRSNLPFKIGITFDHENQGVDDDNSSLDAETTLKKLGVKIEENLESYLSSHLDGLSAHKSVEVPKIEETKINSPKQVPKERAAPSPFIQEIAPQKSAKPQKLTPLQAPQAYFVPLNSRRKKISLNLDFNFSRKKKIYSPPTVAAIISRGLLIALALYFGTLAFSGTILYMSFKNIYKTIANESLPRPNRLNTFCLSYVRANWYMISNLPIISQNQSVADINLLLDAYGELDKALSSTAILSGASEKLVKYIFGGGEDDIASLISLSRLESETLYQKLSLLDGSLPSTPPTIIPEKYEPVYLAGKSKLIKLKNTITSTRALLATAPDIIGVGGRRKYGVLFQNNMELRATGGFIGSFAILSFENGKLYDMPIYDVYDADGQLKGHVEPPVAIKDILGEANWYLRDSNFDPDFPTSARRAEWFIKKTLNQDLDGIIAVNVDTLSLLLGATGPIELADYDETINKDNLYERAQFHAEVNFFPGSTQKKEFLSTVANSLFAKLPTLNSEDGLKLVAALSDSIEAKNTLISVLNTTSEHIFQTLGWNGQLRDAPCPSTSDCYKDYAMVVDSNFGVNKANYFVKRDIESVITLDKNLTVNHILRLNYQNTSTSTAWPAGAYKNYQRIYLPLGANVTRLSIDKLDLQAKDYTITQEHGKAVISHLVTVPIGSSLEIALEYTTPQLQSREDPLYTWYWQKQPGTSSRDTLKVYLNYPMYLSPSVVSPPASTLTQQLSFDLLNDKDRRLAVKFTK